MEKVECEIPTFFPYRAFEIEYEDSKRDW